MYRYEQLHESIHSYEDIEGRIALHNIHASYMIFFYHSRYIGFIKHFIAVYERLAPRYAEEDAAWYKFVSYFIQKRKAIF
jgi:hypothetical protein